MSEHTAKSWLWPDHVIGKRESRALREEHNALVNACEPLADPSAFGEVMDAAESLLVHHRVREALREDTNSIQMTDTFIDRFNQLSAALAKARRE